MKRLQRDISQILKKNTFLNFKGWVSRVKLNLLTCNFVYLIYTHIGTNLEGKTENYTIYKITYTTNGHSNIYTGTQYL